MCMSCGSEFHEKLAYQKTSKYHERKLEAVNIYLGTYPGYQENSDVFIFMSCRRACT